MLRLKLYSVIHFFFIVIELKYLYLKDTILSPDLKEGRFNIKLLTIFFCGGQRSIKALWISISFSTMHQGRTFNPRKKYCGNT